MLRPDAEPGLVSVVLVLLAILCRRLVGRQLLDWQPVQRAGRAVQVFAATVQVNHRRDETRVTEQLADRQQIHTRFQ